MADDPKMQSAETSLDGMFSEAVSVVPTAADIDAARRRQRVLLGVLMLMGIAGAAYGARIQYKKYSDRETLAALMAVGLHVTNRGSSIAITDPTRSCASDNCLQHIGDLNCKIIVNFDNCSQITDAGLAHLRGHSQICMLSLRDTRVTDAGMQSLAGMSSLESLDLSGTEVSDAGVATLDNLNLEKLVDLHLDSTKVTDAVMSDLGQVPTLRYVILEQTDVTQDGARLLKSAIPEVMVFGIR